MLITTVCAALSAAGLAVAFLTAYRRRFVAATRIAAFALLPVGLAMAGLVELGGEVGKAVGDWATDLVFKPTVWSGFGVLAVAVVLYVIARFAAGRAGAQQGAAGPSRKERRAAARAERAQASAPGASAPSLGPGKKEAGKPAGGSGGSGGAGAGEDFSDIEAILKKHGI
ncbi:hypothetical protein DVA86_06495 [Streptomyces armeniacus]|uniref:Cellulose synthase n=1 Tax=Streptomyces armeniacus TaxID=83291 RepID=A0A345XZR8_9ACTN|nr:hypothetical protein [Streptomyces armeniacus]AXK37134.1 hypothetical protein DVA86_06495 [Streptomyces armeniacus]